MKISNQSLDLLQQDKSNSKATKVTVSVAQLNKAIVLWSVKRDFVVFYGLAGDVTMGCFLVQLYSRGVSDP